MPKVWKLAALFFGALTLLFIALQLPPVQSALGKRGIERAIIANITTDVLMDLPDGLHVILAGTGSPMADPTRAGPSTVVIAGDRIFVVDVGSGSPRKMAQMRIPMGQIERILLTHFHSDHIDSLGELMLQRWAGGSRVDRVPVHGSKGIEQVVSGFNLAYGIDKGHRVAHHGPTVVPPSGFGGDPVPFDITSGATVILDDGSVRITAFPVAHDPVDEAVGYRIEYGGRSVTLSGDTAFSESLIRHATGSDLLVHETLNKDIVLTMQIALTEAGNTNLARIMSDIPEYHTTPVEAAMVAQRAGVDALVFSHIIPPVPARFLNAYYMKGVSDAFDGPATLGEDGMIFSMPSGTDTIRRDHLLR